MRRKKRGKKAGTASKKGIIASVTQEMARPRMVESAQLETNKQLQPKVRRPV